MSTDESLIRFTTEAIEKLKLAMRELFKHSQSHGDETYDMGALGRSIGLIRAFQKPIFDARPDLMPPLPEDRVPDPPLTPEQIALVNTLSESDIRQIDETLLAGASGNWRKVARVVATAMMEIRNRIVGIPEVYCAQRIRHLVEEGRLESQGSLAYMGYSEVRLPSKGSDN